MPPVLIRHRDLARVRDRPQAVLLQGFFSCFANSDQSDVIVLWLRSNEAPQLVDQTRDYSRRATRRAGANGLDNAVKAKFISVCVERFGHSIRVEKQAIVLFQRESEVARYPIEHASTVNSDDHAERLYRRHGFSGALVKKRRIMSGARKQ